MLCGLRKFGAFVALFVTSSSLHATLLDWDIVAWTAGSLTNSYDIDPGNPGNDVAVAVSGDTGQLQPGSFSPNPQTPAVTTHFQGGLPVAENALSLGLDLTDQAQAVTFTINFAGPGVTNVSFQIFDIDFDDGGGSRYQDEIHSITALSIDGSTLIAPTITISPNTSLSGSGINQVVDGTVSTSDTGPSSGNANITIDFGANWIQSFTFTYGSGSNTHSNPTYQHIAIHDIFYTPVPEINPAWSAITCCIIAIALSLRRAYSRKARD